jgi:hypothetical protein
MISCGITNILHSIYKGYTTNGSIPLVLDCYKPNSILRLLKKRCRILPDGGLGVSPSFKKSPKIGGLGGLIEALSAVSIVETR